MLCQALNFPGGTLNIAQEDEKAKQVGVQASCYHPIQEFCFYSLIQQVLAEYIHFTRLMALLKIEE